MADGDKTVTDNYRCITLSPVVSKLFEMVLMQLMQLFNNTQLQLDNLQYGFKRNSSCSHAVFTLRIVVERYVRDGSTVTLCALDISKAFDRMDHYALVDLL